MVNMDLEYKTYCFYQLYKVMRPTEKEMYELGIGDCNTCTYNKYENPKCKGFRPQTITTYDYEEYKDLRDYSCK